MNITLNEKEVEVVISAIDGRLVSLGKLAKSCTKERQEAAKLKVLEDIMKLDIVKNKIIDQQ